MEGHEQGIILSVFVLLAIAMLLVLSEIYNSLLFSRVFMSSSKRWTLYFLLLKHSVNHHWISSKQHLWIVLQRL